MGNRLTKTENGVTTSYVYDLCNKLLSETTGEEETAYNYDALGNLTAKTDGKGTTTYAYDALNQLAEVVNPDGTWQTNTYDASGIRSMIAENGVTTEFMTFNGLVLSGHNKDGEQTEHYFYGNSLLAVEYPSEETDLYYYLKNSHRDVIGITDSNGTLTETYRYDAFGTLISIQSLNENGVLAETETALSRFLYAGEQMDSTTGLYYLRARQYDTVIGRFTQEDSYLGDDRNLYVYVSNNPLKYVDPSGYCSKELGYNFDEYKYSGYAYSGFMPKEIVEFQKQQEEAEQQAWLNALNAGFTTPDSYSGYLGQQWGIRIAPTVQKDPVGSAYAFKQGFLDSIIPLRSSNDYYYTDLCMTGQLFGMIFTGGVSEYVSGMNMAANFKIPMVSMQPQYSLAGAGSYSVVIEGTIEGALIAEGFAGAYFGWSAGKTIGSTANSLSSVRPEAAVTGSKKHGIDWKEGLARAKATGKPQGQWAESDLDFATEMANTLSAGESAYFDLPKGSKSVVYMPDGTMKPATRIWIRNNGSGTWHGYPMQ